MEKPLQVAESDMSPPAEDNLSDIDFSELDIELNSWRFDPEVLQSLISRSSGLHLDMLFYRNSKNRHGELCRKMYTVIIKRIGGTMSYAGLNGWRDMAFGLGLKMVDVDYIEYSLKTCPTEMCLRVAKQDKYACFNKLLLVLKEMGRFDVIKSLEEPLTELLDMLGIDEHSQNEPVRPKYLSNNLPDVLKVSNSDDDEEEDANNDESRVNDLTDLANIKDVKEDMILLTHTTDGLTVAQKIRSKLKKKAPNLKVVVLDDLRSEIMESPEQTIRNYLDKVDFVVPILTKGYFSQIQSTAVEIPSLTDNLDHTYARFIYRLCTDHYIYATGLYNKMVRPIVPDKQKEVLSKLYRYPVLLAYTWEKDLDVFIKKLYKL